MADAVMVVAYAVAAPVDVAVAVKAVLLSSMTFFVPSDHLSDVVL